MKLSEDNRHPRDEYITFKEEGHIYTIKGSNKKPISVTTLIGKYWEKFNPELVSSYIIRSKKMLDPTYKYYGMTQQEIIDSWKNNNAAQLGTDMHYKIELYFNDELPLDEYPNTKEFKFFLQYINDFLIVNPDYKPYRTEWLVFDGFLDNRDNCGYGNISGSIDMIYVNSLGKIVIFDWKRVKNLDDCYKNKKGKYILSHLKDTKFNHYSLQLNVYRHILETWYNKEVVGMYLAIFHPDNDTYNVREVKRMDNEVKMIFDSVINK